MIGKPMDVLEMFPVRKSRKQKQTFRDEVQSYAKELGYECSVEKGSLSSRNVVIGNPKTARYLVTAHYDTCARLPFPNLITPCNFWVFLAYQLFTVVYIFGLAALGGVLVYFLTKDSAISGQVAYMLVWMLLILMMVGPANKNNANDNTSGVVTVLEIAGTLPEELRDKVCFVLFDLEEAGLIGSSSFAGKHKNQIRQQIVLNLDCVGDGDQIMMFPTKKLKKDPVQMDALRSICCSREEKVVSLREKGFSVYPSDQSNFPYGVGIAALHKSWAGPYLSRIHTPKDTILEEENVNILRDSLITLIGGTAAE